MDLDKPHVTLINSLQNGLPTGIAEQQQFKKLIKDWISRNVAFLLPNISFIFKTISDIFPAGSAPALYWNLIRALRIPIY